MPEGDTIHRTAQALDRALAGHALVRFEAPRLWPRYRPFPPGTRVDGADAVGKHCLVHFDDGRTLRTHLQMTGSWHLYRPGERWRKSRGAMRVVIAVAEWEAVCFEAPVVELAEQPAVAHLGPDLCRPDADLDEAVRRMADCSPPDRAIGDVLLDQRVVAGIGNIWRNEACFACGVHPATPLTAVRSDQRRRLVELASEKLRASTAGRRPAMAVYGRGGEPCRRCGTTIRSRRLGDHGRIAYWCPACQPVRSGT